MGKSHKLRWVKMNKVFIVILVITALLVAWQPAGAVQSALDEERIEHDYLIEVAGGKFVFVMLAIEKDPDYYFSEEIYRNEEIRQRYPQSGLYATVGATEPIWTIDWYAFEVNLFAEGKYLVRWGFWPRSGEYDALAVAFYQEGRQLHRYHVNDLVLTSNLTTLEESVSHYAWLAERSFDTNQRLLFLETYSGEHYVFDITTGAVVAQTQVISTKTPVTAIVAPYTWDRVVAMSLALAISLLIIFAVAARRE